MLDLSMGGCQAAPNSLYKCTDLGLPIAYFLKVLAILVWRYKQYEDDILIITVWLSLHGLYWFASPSWFSNPPLIWYQGCLSNKEVHGEEGLPGDDAGKDDDGDIRFVNFMIN